MKDTLNKAIVDIEEAQTTIRLIVKDAFLHGMPMVDVNKRILRVIEKATKEVKIERLKGDIERSLWNFANHQRILWSRLPVSAAFLAVVVLGMQGKDTTLAISKLPPSSMEIVGNILYDQKQKGVPLELYYKDVWKEKVKPTLDSLCRDNALDPNDLRGRNSLRNLAEMEVRYREHQENIETLRNSGARLVVASSHADCSDRCARWQGRVYSLNGTSGTTADGRRFVPLETATDVYYTTKAGRVYKNGLLGFNCRHHLMPYKEGMGIPYVSKEEREKEYAITKKQRELERNVRAAKAEAAIYKGIYNKQASAARKAAQVQYEKYKEFCKENGRAYYPMRVAI